MSDFEVTCERLDQLPPIREAINNCGGGLALVIVEGEPPSLVTRFSDPLVCKWILDVTPRDRDGDTKTLQSVPGFHRFHATEDDCKKVIGDTRRFICVVSFVPFDLEHWRRLTFQGGCVVDMAKRKVHDGEADRHDG